MSKMYKTFDASYGEDGMREEISWNVNGISKSSRI